MKKIDWKIAAAGGVALGVGLGGFALATPSEPRFAPEHVDLVSSDQRVSSPSSPVGLREAVPPTVALRDLLGSVEARATASMASGAAAGAPTTVETDSVDSPNSPASAPSMASVESESVDSPESPASPPSMASVESESVDSPESPASPPSMASVDSFSVDSPDS